MEQKVPTQATQERPNYPRTQRQTAASGILLQRMARYSRRRNYDPGNMGKGDGIVLEGEIVENLPNTQFRVHLPEMDKAIIAVVSGKMRRNWVRLLVGDKVRVEFSPYDLERARIIAKLK